MQLGKLTEEDREKTLENIHGTTQMQKVSTADLIIEAAPEQLQLKQDLLRETESLSDHNFIFASNTSSLSITEIARAARRPERVVGMHFFNPVHLMRLLEIVVGKATAEETVETVREVGRRMRKEPIIVNDVPGFASSRLGVALGLEAMRMLEQGVASAMDIDKAMELGYNHPMGPLKLTDVVGLDVRLNIAEYLHHALGSETFRPRMCCAAWSAKANWVRRAVKGFIVGRRRLETRVSRVLPESVTPLCSYYEQHLTTMKSDGLLYAWLCVCRSSFRDAPKTVPPGASLPKLTISQLPAPCFI